MMMIMMMNLALTEYSIAQLQSSLPGLLTPSKARQIQHQSFVAALALAAQHASKAYVFSLQHEIHPTPRVQQCHLKRHVSLSHHFCCNNTAILLFDNPPPPKKKLHQKLGLTSPKLHPKLKFSTQKNWLHQSTQTNFSWDSLPSVIRVSMRPGATQLTRTGPWLFASSLVKWFIA